MERGDEHRRRAALHPAATAAPRCGAALWRSLDELADTEEFRRWLVDEFPAGTSERLEGSSRREMLRVMAASFVLAGLGGCRSPAPTAIVPPVHLGVAAPADAPLWFATAVTRNAYAQGVLVKSVGGRPIKVEGNPDHPASLGATDIFAQAAILSLYDPDRAQAVYRGRDISTWSAARAALAERMEPVRQRGGRGLRLLTAPTSSPLLLHEIRALLAALPEARWHVHATVDAAHGRAGARLVLEPEAEFVPRLDRAAVIVALDADLLYDAPGSVRHARDFAGRRGGRAGAGAPELANRLYVAEPCPSVTGAAADHRLALPASQIAALARRLYEEVESRRSGADTARAALPEAAEHWARAAARDLLAQRERGLVLAGESQPPVVHACCLAINERLGNFGRTLMPVEPFVAEGLAGARGLSDLGEEMRRGAVDVLLILDANPVYDGPADAGFAEALAHVPFSVHAGLYRDETARECRWHLPLAHEFECWGDARAYDGTVTIVQPLIEPLYAGRSPAEVVGLLAGAEERPALEVVQQFWRERAAPSDFDGWWRETLARGVVAGSAARPVQLRRRADFEEALAAVERGGGAPAPPAGLELNLRPDPTVGDGRSANNAWLQELPKPLTQLTWDNAVLLSPATARELGVRNEDVLEIAQGDVQLTAPAWVLPGHADGSATIHLGYGRWAGGRVADGRGSNAYRLRRADALWLRRGVTLRRTGARRALACTQHQQLTAGREAIRVETLAALVQRGGSAGAEHGRADQALSLYPARGGDGPQWGMVIDLGACIGCGACVVACQAENNIPVVGAEQVRRGRRMHWIRVDRYFAGEAEAPAMHHQPVPCMHCENAPCEVVCPVGATTHSHDGLNEMTYNRCVGTRYCSNNCPYKVRRFNFLQYADRATASLALQRNPQVTVRERGVMEKCTYCVQRIRTGEIAARRAGRVLRDGEIVTACQQACPAQAIVFGDIADSASGVAAARRAPHHYALLGELNVRPRTTYLARVRNPDPELAEEEGRPA